MTGTSYRQQSVPVDGGELRVGVWGDEGRLVVLIHGITSTHMAWALVGPDLGRDHWVIGVDLRGRGGSRDLPPPYGMARHAADIAAVVEAYGGGPAVLVGHSMGGWVATETARGYPLVVDRLVLVDGGAPLPVPGGLDMADGDEAIAEAIAKTLGPTYARLSMTFPSRESYRDMWRAHPSFGEWSEAIQSYVDYDLVGDEPQLRPSCRLEAALRDARDLYAFDGVSPAPLPVPAVFLRAERGMLNEETPFYLAGYAGGWLPGVVEHTVAGVNHYSITLGPAGAAAVTTAVRARA
jgi:pimeloyl-ACP methyl ester carboxylesterase